MSRTHYKIYKEQTFVLAKTLIVKHEEIATAMNDELNARMYVVDSNPYNWRYYLNLNGEYHVADSDDLYEQYGTPYLMVRIPTDLGPIEVPLTKELMHGVNADKSIVNEYQIGSKLYNEILSRYPDYETLIIGILNPIDMEVAIKADNGEILFIAGRYKQIIDDRKWFEDSAGVNLTLIEPQEDNIIFEIQKYINIFLRHWNNPDYAIGNDLYTVTMLGILYCNIPNAIFNIRLGNCKSPRAHTFHIRQYLESHGNIGRYVDFIPIATSLWLYRNATYLEANSGKQLTFDALLDNTLTPNEIPMSAYSIRHELTNLGNDKLLPTGMLYKETLNFEVMGASDDDRTVRDILEDQIPLARDNDKDLDDKERRIQDIINWGGDDRLNTKVLESEMIELGDPYPFTLTQFLFNMWGYTAIKGFYTASAFATNPLTGDRLSFSSKNAYILATYCLNRSIAGITLKTVPTVKLYQIPRTINPSDFPSDPRYHPKPSVDKAMSWVNNAKTRRLKVAEVIGSHNPIFVTNNAESFFNNVNDIYHERIRKYNTYSDVSELEEKGDLELVAKQLYWMGFDEPLLDIDYTDWFRTVGFDPDQFTDNDLMTLGLELVASATGIADQKAIRKKWLQQSLLAIMKHFISYSVHIIEKFADGVVAYLEGQALRYSNVTWRYTGSLAVKYSLAHDYTVKTDVKQRMHLDISNVFESTTVDIKSSISSSFDISGLEYGQSTHRINAGIYSLTSHATNLEFNTSTALPVNISVIDNIVNTILITSVNAAVNDSPIAYTVSADDHAISTDNKYGLITEAFISVYSPDDVKSSVSTGVTSITRVDNLPETLRSDLVAVSTPAVQGGIKDANVVITIVDSSGIVALRPHGYINSYVNTNESNAYDIESLSIVRLAGTVKDIEIEYVTVDSNSLVTSGVSVKMTDPQIPEVSNEDNLSAAVINNISAAYNDAPLSINTSDLSAITIHQLSIDIVDEMNAIKDIVDDASVVITNLTMSRRDNGVQAPQLDMHSLAIGNITVKTTTMEAVKSTTLPDVSAIGISNITGVATDRFNLKVTDDNAVITTGITVGIADVEVSASTADADMINISDVLMSYKDIDPSAKVAEINSISIARITGQVIDYPDKVTSVELTDTIIMGPIAINYTELNALPKQTDKDGISLNPKSIFIKITN